MAVSTAVRVGDPAPDFTIAGPDGKTAKLSDYRGVSPVVVFFYPKDNSPACTAEACSFRDSFEAFREAGAEVIGISGDSDTTHQGFAARYQLPFQLVSDADGAIRAAYGVPKTLGLFPGRVSYVIDRQGIVRHIFASQLQPRKHVEEALRVLKTLR